MLMCWHKLKHRLVHITCSSEKTKEFTMYAYMYTITGQELVANLAGVYIIPQLVLMMRYNMLLKDFSPL